MGHVFVTVDVAMSLGMYWTCDDGYVTWGQWRGVVSLGSGYGQAVRNVPYLG